MTPPAISPNIYADTRVTDVHVDSVLLFTSFSSCVSAFVLCLLICFCSLSSVQCCFTSTGLLETGSPGRPPLLSHRFRALTFYSLPGLLQAIKLTGCCGLSKECAGWVLTCNVRSTTKVIPSEPQVIKSQATSESLFTSHATLCVKRTGAKWSWVS